MTPVKFEFLEPDGSPMANVTFEIRMAKSGFLEAVDGIVMPDTVLATTDAEGKVTVMLAPSSSLYYLKVINEDVDTDEDCCAPGIFYKFYVPNVQTEVRVQDLIMDPPPSTTAWDEAAILIILEAKAAAKDSADAAKISEDNAAASEAVVVEQAAIVADNTTITTQAALAAALSETNAKNSQDAARASELAAEAAADFAGSAVVDMQDQVDEATAQAVLAGQAKDTAVLAANTSTSNAALTAADVLSTHADVVTTTTNKQATAADVVAVTTMKGEVSDLKDQTEIYRDEALAAVETITGVFTDGGLVDLSGGAYPPKPSVSTIWRVSVGGTVTTVPEGTIVYGTGDQLVYTKTQDVWYKTDNQNAVTEVNGKKGAVVLNATDVGLGNVNNTSDMDKPVSNAQQTQFNLRVPTATKLDKTAGRLTKVGDYGENGGPPIARLVSDDANALTIDATYAFADGGINVPEAVYLKHVNLSTAGYSKQIAYGILTDKQYVRTQVNGVWSNWTSAVEIIDALTSTDPNKALSAKQGKVLYDLLLANNATIVRYSYSLASGVTVISGADITGKTLSYVPGTPMIVDKDGFSIQPTKDYTASNGTSLVLATATEQACEVTVTVFGAFTVADHYTKAEDDALLATKASVTRVSLIEATYNKLTLDILQAATSGVSKSFVIPANAKRITVLFNALSTNGSANVLLQLGSGTIQGVSYSASNTTFLNGSATVTPAAGGFPFGGAAANVYQGSITLTHMGGNTWIAQGTCQFSNTAATSTITGSVTLAGVIDQLRLVTANTTDTFDSGTVNVLVEV